MDFNLLISVKQTFTGTQVRGLSFSPQTTSTESVTKPDSRLHLSRFDFFLFISRNRKVIVCQP